MMGIPMRSDDRCTAGLTSPSWAPGWDLPLHKAFMRAITLDRPSTADMTTLIDELFRQVSRDVKEGVSGPEAFNLPLRRLMPQFDRVNKEDSYPRLHNFRVCKGTPFCDIGRAFRVLVSAVTGGEGTVALGGKRGFGGG